MARPFARRVAAPQGGNEGEYDQIIDANGIDDEEAYLTTVRTGRPRITRDQRRAAWPVFRAFLRGLKKRSLLTFEGAIHQARLAVEQGNFTRYNHVLVDEVQDLSLEALRLVRAMSPIDGHTSDPLCTVGDGHQRIYRSKIPLSRAGIEIRGRSRPQDQLPDERANQEVRAGNSPGSGDRRPGWRNRIDHRRPLGLQRSGPNDGKMQERKGRGRDNRRLGSDAEGRAWSRDA